MVLDDLIQLIKSRKNGDANKSYTARLFNQGLEECCKKFGEESVELIIAALNKKDDNLNVFFNILIENEWNLLISWRGGD